MSEDRFKFRIWEINNEKMIYQHEDRLDKFFNKLSFPLHWGNLMQCTGLKDNNGNLIFEGDVVKRIYHNDTFTIGNGGFSVHEENKVYPNKIDDGEYSGVDVHIKQYMEVYGDVVILGNIHENPELLGDKND